MSQPSSESLDRRQEPRRITAQPAVIVFEGARRRLPCIVRNISSSGAKLEIFEHSQVPLTFDLLLDRRLMPCRLIWRELLELGITFEARGK